MLSFIITASLVIIAGGQEDCEISQRLRMPCGSPGISEKQCLRLNCCFARPSTQECYKKGDRCAVPSNQRIPCDTTGPGRSGCSNKDCCFDDTPEAVACYYNQQVTSTAVRIPGDDDDDDDDDRSRSGISLCNIGGIVDSVRNLIESWKSVVTGFRGIGSVFGVVEKVGTTFSVRTYCEIYTLAIDSIVDCGGLIQPLVSLFGVNHEVYLNALNDIEDTKGVCNALLGVGGASNLCVPNAPAFCFVTSFDLLISIVKQVTRPGTGCMQTKELLIGIPKCIDSSTNGCAPEMRGDLDQVKTDTMKVADFLGGACISGCTELANFFLDRHETCSWNVKRIFPGGSPTGYCEVIDRVVQCAWEMWTLCPLLPRKHFERALSASLQTNNIVGCNPIVLPDYVPDERYQVKFPPCLVAASECTRAVGGLIGFVNDDTEFGGFEFTGVGDKVRELRDMLIDGDFSGLCGPKNEDQSPLSYCINSLVDECGATTDNMRAREISKVVADNVDDVCHDDCVRLSRNVFRSRNDCADEIEALFEGTNVLNVAWEVVKGVIQFNSNNGETCTALRGYVSCLAMLVEKCPFFHKRVSEIRGALVSALSKIPNYRPLDIMVCGIKLDYPFEFNDDRWPSIVLRFRSSTTTTSQQWLPVTALALTISVHHFILNVF